MKQKPSRETLEHKFYIDGHGNLRWRHPKFKSKQHKKAGGEWGTVNINGKGYQVAHILFFLHFGYWPQRVDYKDGNSKNIKKENLFEGDHSTTAKRKKTPRHNTSGMKGLRPSRSGKWEATINVNKRQVHRIFETFREAYSWRKKMEEIDGGYRKKPRIRL